MTIELGIKELPVDTLERFLIIIERNIRNYIDSQVDPKDLLDIEISAEINQEDTLSIDIEVNVEINDISSAELNELIEQSIDKAEYAITSELKNLKLKDFKQN